MNISGLNGLFPEYVFPLLKGVGLFHINTPLRMAHFLSQCSHESAGFKVLRENLNYSADGLMKIFPKYFKTTEEAVRFAKQPQNIANKVYANRMGNGDESTGDGFKFRGRGFIQLTGKNNYAEFGRSINIDLVEQPDRVAKEFPLLSAAWFFDKNGLNDIADEGSEEFVVKKITKKINGGTIGFDDRLKRFKEFYQILSV